MADAHSAAGRAARQTTTTTFDVIESQAILQQLAGRSGRIYRTEQRGFVARVLGVLRRWLRRGRGGGEQVS